MAYLYETLPLERIRYAPGAVIDREIPRGNLFAGISALLKGKVNINTAAGNHAPDFQVLNLVRELELIKDTTTVMRISGQKLAMLFSYRNGKGAVNNAALAGAVANNKSFQHFLPVVFAADDAARPDDLLMDTRAHKYTLRVTWDDAKDTGVLFGTNASSVEVVNADDITLEFELERLGIINMAGMTDKYANATPKMRGLLEVPMPVTQNGEITIDFPVDKLVRNIFLYATTVANNSTVGSNEILTGDIKIENTNGKTFHRRRAEFVRNATSHRFGLGAEVPTGLYHIELTKFGNIVDSLRDTASSRMKIKADATKLAGTCTLFALFDTIENQGA